MALIKKTQVSAALQKAIETYVQRNGKTNIHIHNKLITYEATVPTMDIEISLDDDIVINTGSGELDIDLDEQVDVTTETTEGIISFVISEDDTEIALDFWN